jgi:hypothetical protein
LCVVHCALRVSHFCWLEWSSMPKLTTKGYKHRKCVCSPSLIAIAWILHAAHAVGGILALLSAFALPCFDSCAAQGAGGRASATMHALARLAHASLPYHVQEARGCKWGGSDSAQKRPRARPRDAPSAYKPNNSLDTQTQRADSVRRHQRRASPLSQQETARDGGGGTSHAPEETEGDRSDSSKS